MPYIPACGKAEGYSEGKNIITGDTEPVSIMKTRSVATTLYVFITSLNSGIGEPTISNEDIHGSAKKLRTKSICTEVNNVHTRYLWIPRKLLNIQ